MNIQLYPHAWVGKPSILNGMDVGVTEIDTQNVNDAKQDFFWDFTIKLGISLVDMGAK